MNALHRYQATAAGAFVTVAGYVATDLPNVCLSLNGSPGVFSVTLHLTAEEARAMGENLIAAADVALQVPA